MPWCNWRGIQQRDLRYVSFTSLISTHQNLNITALMLLRDIVWRLARQAGSALVSVLKCSTLKISQLTIRHPSFWKVAKDCTQVVNYSRNKVLRSVCTCTTIVKIHQASTEWCYWQFCQWGKANKWKKAAPEQRQELDFATRLPTGSQACWNLSRLVQGLSGPLPSACLQSGCFQSILVQPFSFLNLWPWDPVAYPTVSTVVLAKHRFYLLTFFAYDAFSTIHAASQPCQSPQATLFLELRGNRAGPVTQRHSFHCFLQTCKNFSEHHFGFCLFHPPGKAALLFPSPEYLIAGSTAEGQSSICEVTRISSLLRRGFMCAK